ncbi:MAG TPA: NAD(P)/FAD-dependent oxidoreductase [Solirubrobacteraceae bacterium]|nr:NAD(P)/FAD-dependent oxidoreductase [Solirubrobacteraceae bacterium]
MNNGYDVIVIGARCAGAPTAMLLARRGYRVLLLDKAAFPSDAMSTHVVHPPGVAALRRWGLLDQLVETGCPPIEDYSLDLGPVTIAGSPQPVDGVSVAYCPRRTVLDGLLVDAAVEAGVEVRQGFVVEAILVDDAGRVTGIRGRSSAGGAVTDHASLVVGADGRHSLLARTVKPEQYHERPSRMAMYYAYWSGLEVSTFATTVRADRRRGWAAAPTHDGLTVLGFGWPIEEFHRNRRDVESNFYAAIELDFEFAERVHAATRESRFVGTAELGGYFRKPFGPGWALVGDAGYHKNPITAMGISDAFRDADLVSIAIDQALTHRRPYGEAMSDYQQQRDRQVAAIYEFTDESAQLAPPPADRQRLLGAISDDQDATNAFISVTAGTLPAGEFFAPENVSRMLGAVAA